MLLYTVLLLQLAASPGFEALFSHRAPVEVEASNLPWVRLPLPAGVLTHASADLSDLRVLDGAGQPVSFRLVRRGKRTEYGARLQPQMTAATVKAPKEAIRGEKPVGREPSVEVYTLELPARPAGVQGWTLWIESDRHEFVCRGALETLSKQGVRRLVNQVPLFRLPRQGAEQLDLPLPAFGADELLRLTLTCDQLVKPRLLVEARTSLEPSSHLDIPVQPHISSEGKVTTLVWPRESGIVPSSLTLETKSSFFDREVSVFDVRDDAARLVGHGRVFRIPGVASAERLELPVGAMTGTQVRLVISDEDAAPLEDLSVTQGVDQPALLLSRAELRPPLHLYFGGGLVTSARFESAGANDVGLSAQIEENATAEARVGPVEANPAFRANGALAGFHVLGATLDPADFSHRMRVQGACPTGVCTVVIPPEAAATLSASRVDVRVVDASHAQVPFFLESTSFQVHRELRAARTEAGHSTYPTTVPGSQVFERLTLNAPASPFRRMFEVSGKDETGRDRVLGRQQLVFNPTGVGEQTKLSMALHGARASDVVLRVLDGDGAPMPTLSVDFEVNVPRLRIVAPGGEYQVLLGNPAAVAARYDIEAAAVMIRAAKSSELTASQLEENPLYRPATRLLRGDGPSQLALWAVLLLAVVVLAGVTARMVRRDSV